MERSAVTEAQPLEGTIGIIGAGRVARALALGLSLAGAASLRLWARDPSKGEDAARHVRDLANRAREACRLATLQEIARDCTMIALAVSDDAIPAVVAQLVQAGPCAQAPLAFHVSGGSGAALLEPLRAQGALTAAIHPVMTFTGDPMTEVTHMRGARFAVTASTDAATHGAQIIVAALGGVAVAIAEEQRTLYHAALSHAANHLVTLIVGAMQTLDACRIDDPTGLIAPLVRAALDNSLTHGFDALSGPVLRGDTGIVRAHLAALAHDCPDILPAYRAMARATVDELGRRHGMSPAQAALQIALEESAPEEGPR